MELPKFSIVWIRSGPSLPVLIMKIFSISLGFAYDFSFCQNDGLSRIIPGKTLSNTLRIENLFGRKFLKYDTKDMGATGPKW